MNIAICSNKHLPFPLKAGDSFVVRFFSSTIIKAKKKYEIKLKMSHLKQCEAQNFLNFSDMYTPARFRILKELQDLKSLLQNLTCSCTDSYSSEDSELNTELLITLNLFQLVIMIGLVIALTLATNLMAKAWNSSTELQTVTTIEAAKSVARKWARNLWF